MKLGQKIALARKQKNLKQDELADIMNVSRSTISLWESNKRKPTHSNLVYLAQNLDKPLGYFLEDSDKNSDELEKISSDPLYNNTVITDDNNNSNLNINDNQQSSLNLDEIQSNVAFVNIKSRGLVKIKLITSVKAGKDTLFIENNDRIMIKVDRTFLPEKAWNMSEEKIQGIFFAVKVDGDSMYPNYQHDDMLIVEKLNGNPIVNGKKYIITIDDKILVKKVFYTKDGFTLISTNDQYEPMHLSKKDLHEKNVTIDYKVIRLIFRDES